MVHAVGTMSLEEFGRLQVYFITYINFWLILTFWILPMALTCLSPLSYRDVVWYSKDVLITAFATGNFLILLPVIASKSKELVDMCNLQGGESGTAVDVIVPTSYNFPSAGKLLSLSFIFFAGCFQKLLCR
jgi:Na+/H+-dicarboxylate symporter